MTEAPSYRRLRDPRELAALAHPVRIGIMELLAVAGPLTATELADRLDETPANCSWHLRKLAEHELIEEAEGGTGRQRPWQMRKVGLSWGAADAEVDEKRAGDALTRVMLQRWTDRFLDAAERAEGEWREAASVSQTMGYLTAEELEEVNRKVTEMIRGFEDRIEDADRRPEGSRLVELVAFASAIEVAP